LFFYWRRPVFDFRAAPKDFPARENEKGRAPSDFPASKNDWGRTSSDWGHVSNRSGCAPFGWGRAQMIRGAPLFIFPPPQTVFRPPLLPEVRLQSFSGAQKSLEVTPISLAARLSLQKKPVFSKKTYLFTLFHH